MVGGQVKNWADMEKVWHYTFYEALHAPEDLDKVSESVDVGRNAFRCAACGRAYATAPGW